jgi:serine/threonine protein kinase
LPIAKQIAEALEAAHEQGVIHRDLSRVALLMCQYHDSHTLALEIDTL